LTPDPEPVKKLIAIRDDLTGKFYTSREELDAARKADAPNIFALLEKRILDQIIGSHPDLNPGCVIPATLPDSSLGKYTREELAAQNIAVLRFKLGLDKE